METEDKKILELIKKIEEEVSTEGALVKFDQYGGGPDESRILANKKGYLSLGIKFLKAAFAEPVKLENDDINEDIEDIDVELDEIVHNDSDINFDWFQRTEKIEQQVYEETFFSGKVVPFLILAIFILTILFALKGCLSMFINF